jgi:hypothetical protein
MPHESCDMTHATGTNTHDHTQRTATVSAGSSPGFSGNLSPIYWMIYSVQVASNGEQYAMLCRSEGGNTPDSSSSHEQVIEDCLARMT